MSPVLKTGVSPEGPPGVGFPLLPPLYTVYRTVNAVNGKFYIGVHKTTDPDDAYLGDKFVKTIVLTTQVEKVAFDLERQLITCARKRYPTLCMNIHEGGRGGFGYINNNGLCNRQMLSVKAADALRRLRQDQDWLEFSSRRMGTRRLMSAMKLGKLNNQYGTRWITNGEINRKLPRDHGLPEGWYFGRKV